MANPKHLEILKQGVEVWNQWREAYPDEKIDLRGVNFSKADLHEANLREANLFGTDLRGADLREANLFGTDLRGADLRKANLFGTDLRKANLRGTSLSKANLCEANLYETYLCDTNLCETNLCGANLCRTNLHGVNLCGAYLNKTFLREANLREANLSGVDMTEVKLGDARLIKTNLSQAILTGAELYGTSRDDWIIDGIQCDYVSWDEAGTEHTPPDRNFRPGEFEELYKKLPTFDYFFKHGFTPIDAVVMDRVVQAINDKHPDFELKLSTLDSRGQPHAVFTVLHKEYVDSAQKQITTDFERRLAALEGKQEQMMELFARIADNPKTIELIMGDKRMIQTSRDYLEHVEGDVTTGESTSEPKKEP